MIFSVSHQVLNVQTLAVTAGCLLLWGLVSAKLERRNISAPIAFVVMGVLVTHGPWALAHVNLNSSSMRAISEFTLALVLFSDAARVNVRELRRDVVTPV